MNETEQDQQLVKVAGPSDRPGEDSYELSLTKDESDPPPLLQMHFLNVFYHLKNNAHVQAMSSVRSQAEQPS